jgi:small-conductance mechanosensitive channel
MSRVALHAVQYRSIVWDLHVCALICFSAIRSPASSQELHLQNKEQKERAMMDVLMLALALLLFAAAIGYTYACDRL